MIRFLTTLVLLLLTGCVSTKQSQPRGDLIFYIKTTEGAFGRVLEKEEGYYFYFDSMGTIVGYEYNDGVIVDVFGGGSAVTKKLISNIEGVKLKDFNFHRELEKAKARLEVENEEAKKNDAEGSFVLAPFVLDGAEYEIFANFMGTSFKFKAWNPGVDIEFYSNREEKFRLLNQWMTAFTSYYGKTKIQY